MDDPPDVILSDAPDAGPDADAQASEAGNEAAAEAHAPDVVEAAHETGGDAAKEAEAGAVPDGSAEAPAAPATDGGCSCTTRDDRGSGASLAWASLIGLAFVVRKMRVRR